MGQEISRNVLRKMTMMTSAGVEMMTIRMISSLHFEWAVYIASLVTNCIVIVRRGLSMNRILCHRDHDSTF